MSARVAVALIALGWSGAAGLAGLLLGRPGRGGAVRSVRGALLAVAVVSVAAVVAGVVGTAQAMFLSRHDLGVAVLVSMVAGVVGLGVALALSARVLADVRVLVRAATSVDPAGGDGELPVPRLAELRRVRDELARTATRLAQARQRERALEDSRRELVAWVSHDLRTPLAGLRAMAEALEDDVVPDPARYHRQIRREVDRLARMVDDLFELSRIQAGALTLALERVAVDELVSDVVAGARPVAEARGVHLHAVVDPAARERAVVDGDLAGLGRVLANLVVNAIRHTPSDGTVSVEVGSSAGSRAVVLAVSDGCGGIGSQDLPRVFEPGWRGSAARTRPSDADWDAGVGAGAGLGLAIARGIVEAHRGRISVLNAGGGCRFEVHLPATS